MSSAHSKNSVASCIVESIPVCHAGDSGSIPRQGAKKTWWLRQCKIYIMEVVLHASCCHHLSKFTSPFKLLRWWQRISSTVADLSHTKEISTEWACQSNNRLPCRMVLSFLPHGSSSKHHQSSLLRAEIQTFEMSQKMVDHIHFRGMHGAIK